MFLKEVCNLLATAWKTWKVAQLKVSNMQISIIIEVVTRHSQMVGR